MSASLRQSVSFPSVGSVNGVSPSWPVATLDGSLLVLVVAIGGTQPSSLCSVPHDWQQVYVTPTGTFDGFGVWVREYCAAQPASIGVPVSWAGSNLAHACVAMFEIVGASAADVVDLVLDGFNVSSRLHAGGTQTPSEDGELLFGVIVTHDNLAQTLEASGSWGQICNPFDSGALGTAKPSLGVYLYPNSTHNTPASVHADVASSVAWHSVMLSFRSLPPAGAPTYDVAVQWNGRNTGLFILGTSTLGGTDVLGGAYTEGTYNLLDQAHGPMSVTIQRGRQDASSAIQAGTCTVVARDSDGRYNPANPSSPLAGLLVPMRPLQVSAVFGSQTYNLYTGFIQSIYDDPSIGGQLATFQCQDMFSWLSATPVISAMGATTTGAAITKMLSTIDWPLALASIDTGDNIPSFEMDGTTTILDAITQLLTAERGVCFVDANGVFTYRNRNAKYSATTQGVLPSVMTGLLPGTDLNSVYTRANVQRNGGVAQVYLDQNAVYAYGFRDLPQIVTPYVNSDAQALQLAQFLVATNKDPRAPVWTCTLRRNLNPALVQQMLDFDIGEVVTITESRGGTVGDYVIEGIQHTIQAGGLDHEVSWTLSQRRSGVFIIGQSTLGGGDFLTY